VHPDVRKLLEVQRVDQEIARLRRDLNSIPAEQERRTKRLAQLQGQRDVAKRALDAAEIESREMELGIKHADEEIAKLRVRLNTVKNNAEYQATLLQMESVKTERNRLEERGLELLEQVEGLRTSAAAAREAHAAEQKVFAEFQEEAARLRAEREAAVAKVSAGRAQLLDGIPGELLERYEDLFGVRDGSVVCAVEGQVCTGCYTSVTMNDLANLMGRSHVVQCGSCQRILYYIPPE
jgi:predicted  nucleic acid-binding Zn-ribbon protein